MSVSVKLNRTVVVCAVAAVALVTGSVAVAVHKSASHDPAATQVRTPAKSLDVVDSHSPAESAIATSRHFFASSPVAVLADQEDPAAQDLAIRAATALRVPVLIDLPTAPLKSNGSAPAPC